MQASPAVCFACRTQQLFAAVRRPRATRPPSPLLSLSLQPSIQTYGTSAGTETSTSSPKDSQASDRNYVPTLDVVDGELPPNRTTPTPRFKQLIRRSSELEIPRKQTNKQDSLKIFSKVVQQQDEREESTPDAPRDLPPFLVDIYNDLAKLRPMMKEKGIEDCYEFFMERIMARAVTPSKSGLIKSRGTYLLKRVSEAKANDMDNKRLPSMSQLTAIYHRLGTLSTTNWSEMVMWLIRYICSIDPKREAYKSDEEFETSRAKTTELLTDLVECWIQFHRRLLSADTSSSRSPEEAEFRFPEIDSRDIRVHAKRGLTSTFSLLFSQYSTQPHEVPAAAIATLVVLMDRAHENSALLLKASPLLHAVGRILRNLPLANDTLYRIFTPYPEVRTYVLERWQETMQSLQAPFAQRKQRLQSFESKRITTRISHALGMVDVTELEAIWEEFWGKAPHDDARKAAMRDCDQIFDHFLMAFTALKRPEMALEVWNKREQVGVPPTLKSWTAMMSGCARARNWFGLENIWRRLLKTGLKLDHTAWSIRISSLMDSGEPEAALNALKEMRKANIDDATGEENSAAVNAVIAGLVRLNATSAALDVIRWASQNMGMKPDIFTYNTLLRPLVRNGDAPAIRAHLETMEKNNIEPDAATLTILLDGLVVHIRNAPPQEQQAAVSRFLATLESTNINLNMQNYARMIHLLIKQGAQSTHGPGAAISAVYEHILNKGLQPSAHIYTLLIQYSLSRSPPAFAPIIRLLEESGVCFGDDGNVVKFDSRSYLRFDRVLYERIITGFALAGYPDHAFGLFECVSNITNAMTLGALDTLLRCLVTSGRRDKAKRVVDLARSQRVSNTAATGSSRAEKPVSRYWRHSFWAYAVDCGLMTKQDLEEMRAAQLSASSEMSPM